MTKRYQRPVVTTIEIPERTAYACNVATNFQGCPHISNIATALVCSPSNFAQYGLPGTCG